MGNPIDVRTFRRSSEDDQVLILDFMRSSEDTNPDLVTVVQVVAGGLMLTRNKLDEDGHPYLLRDGSNAEVAIEQVKVPCDIPRDVREAFSRVERLV